MAEDQGVNGDIWTDEACRLFKKAGWQKFADSNIDIEGVDGASHGIDALFQYEDGFNPRMNQGVFLEAKRYATTSFKKDHLNQWVNKLAYKIGNIKNSSKFLTTYPTASNLKMDNGVIAIWFHDVDNYKTFKEAFAEYLKEVKLPEGRVKRSSHTRIFVLDNERILRLASLLSEIENLNRKYDSVKFYYHSSSFLGNPVQQITTINLEYIFSDFVLAKARKNLGETFEVIDIVFYFGELQENSFNRLSDALLTYGMISNQNELIIYKYKRDDEFRKIEPDVIDLFKSKSPKNIKIQDMDNSNNLPSWILNDE